MFSDIFQILFPFWALHSNSLKVEYITQVMLNLTVLSISWNEEGKKKSLKNDKKLIDIIFSGIKGLSESTLFSKIGACFE